MTVHGRIEQVFRDILGDDGVPLDDASRPVDLPRWDSLAHVNVMFSLEEAFGVTFVGDEFSRLETIGDLKAALAAKGVSEAR